MSRILPRDYIEPGYSDRHTGGLAGRGIIGVGSLSATKPVLMIGEMNFTQFPHKSVLKYSIKMIRKAIDFHYLQNVYTMVC